jgi:sugar phosphate isomerase/epimerase
VEVDTDYNCKYLHHPAKSYNVGTSDGLSALGDDLKARGVAITAFCMHNRLDERLEEELKWTNGVIVAARQLKVPVIRIDVVPLKTPAAEFLTFAIDACKKLCELTAKTGVRLGIENHGGTTNDPAFLEKLLAGVNSPDLGVTLDVANLYWFGHPLDEVYRICERLAPKAVHTHCKNIKYPEDKRNVRREMGWKYDTCSAPVYEGDLDFGKVAKILRKAGYQGDLCLENECVGRFPEAERLEVLRREAALLLKLAQG